MSALFEAEFAGRAEEAEPPVAAVPPPAPRALPYRRRLRLALGERFDMDKRALIGLAVLIAVASGYAVQHFWWARPEPVGVPERGEVTASAGASSAADAPTTGGTVVVDIAGRVAHPGVRTLPTGSRVQDALRAAGGPLPGTDTTAINLARKLVDGEEVVIGTPAAAPGASAGPGPVSLNSATAQQLDALPGVGPVLAERIVQYRERHGGFSSVDQLRKVQGLGERRFQDLKELVRP